MHLLLLRAVFHVLLDTSARLLLQSLRVLQANTVLQGLLQPQAVLRGIIVMELLRRYAQKEAIQMLRMATVLFVRLGLCVQVEF